MQVLYSAIALFLLLFLLLTLVAGLWRVLHGPTPADRLFLKYQVAAIEGVIDTKIHATFLARL